MDVGRKKNFTTGRGREMDQPILSILPVVDEKWTKYYWSWTEKALTWTKKADRGRKPIIFLQLLDERVFNCCARWTMINPKQSLADELLDNMRQRASLYNVKTAKRGQCYAKTTDVGRSVIQKGACRGRMCSKVWALDGT